MTSLIGFFVEVGLLIGGSSELRLDRRLLRPDFGLLERLLHVSLPAAESVSMVAGQMVFLSVVKGLGDAALPGRSSRAGPRQRARAG